MERPRHRHRDRPLAGQDLGDLRAAADERDQIARTQACLLHAELYCGDRIGVSHRFVPALVQLDEIDQHVEFTGLRSWPGSASMSSSIRASAVS